MVAYLLQGQNHLQHQPLALKGTRHSAQLVVGLLVGHCCRWRWLNQMTGVAQVAAVEKLNRLNNRLVCDWDYSQPRAVHSESQNATNRLIDLVCGIP